MDILQIEENCNTFLQNTYKYLKEQFIAKGTEILKKQIKIYTKLIPLEIIHACLLINKTIT